MAHTSTPWTMEVTHVTTAQTPFVYIDHKIAEFESIGICNLSLNGCVEYAAFIVKAVNAHDDLVASRDRALLTVATIVTWLEVNQPDVFKRGLWEVLAAKSEVQS